MERNILVRTVCVVVWMESSKEGPGQKPNRQKRICRIKGRRSAAFSRCIGTHLPLRSSDCTHGDGSLWCNMQHEAEHSPPCTKENRPRWCTKLFFRLKHYIVGAAICRPRPASTPPHRFTTVFGRMVSAPTVFPPKTAPSPSKNKNIFSDFRIFPHFPVRISLRRLFYI